MKGQPRSITLTAKDWAAVGGYNPQHQLPDVPAEPAPTALCRFCEGVGLTLDEHGLLVHHWRSGAVPPRSCRGTGMRPKAVS